MLIGFVKERGDQMAEDKAKRWRPTDEELEKILSEHTEWLKSREKHGARADLSGADLMAQDLSGENLVRANLSGAQMWRADLSKAEMRGANLHGADLERANLSGAHLTRANLSDARLVLTELPGTDLRWANLCAANLYGANLIKANLAEADLRGTNFAHSKLARADLAAVRVKKSWRFLPFWRIKTTHLFFIIPWYAPTRFLGAAVENVKPNNPLLKRYIQDQQHLEAIAESAWGGDFFSTRHPFLKRLVLIVGNSIRHPIRSPIRSLILFLWGITCRCGTSFFLWFSWSIFFAFIFGFIFAHGDLYVHANRRSSINPAWAVSHLILPDKPPDPDAAKVPGLVRIQEGRFPGPFPASWTPALEIKHHNCITPYYYSVVTFTTLGFGDVVPVNKAGMIWVAIEVALGYLMLGGLISIFATKVFRLS